MSSTSSRNSGNPLISAAVVGSFSFALALVLEIVGVYRGVVEGLWHAYDMRGFQVGEGAEHGLGGLWVIGGLVYFVAWLLCEVPEVHRRVLVLLSALVLIALASPVLALWGVYWSPVAAMVATAWSGFCAILWAQQHRMPCEGVRGEKTARGKIIPMEEGKSEKVQRRQS